MALTIYPSENDVAATTGEGRVATEKNQRAQTTAIVPYAYMRIGSSVFQGPGRVIGGFEVLSTAGLTATLASGKASLLGYRVEESASTALALTDAKYNSVFMRLDKTSDKATGVTYQINTSDAFEDFGTIPADSLLLYVFRTVGGSVFTTWDYRQWASGIVGGSYAGNGTNARFIDLGFKPKLVKIVQRGANGLIAFSELGSVPPNSGTLKGLSWAELRTGADLVVQLSNDARLSPRLTASPVAGFQVDGATDVTITGRRWDDYRVLDTWSDEINGTSHTGTIAAVDSVFTDPIFGQHENDDAGGLTIVVKVTTAAPGTIDWTTTNTSGGNLTLAGDLVIAISTFNTVAMSLNKSGEVYDFIAFS